MINFKNTPESKATADANDSTKNTTFELPIWE